jgi:hypothetical protein
MYPPFVQAVVPILPLDPLLSLSSSHSSPPSPICPAKSLPHSYPFVVTHFFALDLLIALKMEVVKTWKVHQFPPDYKAQHPRSQVIFYINLFTCRLINIYLNHCLYRKLQYHVDDRTNHNVVAEHLSDLTMSCDVMIEFYFGAAILLEIMTFNRATGYVIRFASEYLWQIHSTCWENVKSRMLRIVYEGRSRSVYVRSSTVLPNQNVNDHLTEWMDEWITGAWTGNLDITNAQIHDWARFWTTLISLLHSYI